MRALVLFAPLLLACGGPPPEAHRALEETARAWNAADEVLASHIRTKGERVRAEILADPNIQTVQQGLDAFDERMQPEADATAALRSSRASLYAAESGLDAWSEGAGAFLAAIPCLIAALESLDEALGEAGVQIPPLISGALAHLSTWAGTCGEGSE
jgi:hypothetical protein